MEQHFICIDYRLEEINMSKVLIKEYTKNNICCVKLSSRIAHQSELFLTFLFETQRPEEKAINTVFTLTVHKFKDSHEWNWRVAWDENLFPVVSNLEAYMAQCIIEELVYSDYFFSLLKSQTRLSKGIVF